MTERQEEIIELALKRFINDGLLKTSARDIADEVGIYVGGLYYFFKDKEEIVIKSAELAIKKLCDELMERTFMDIDNPEEMLDRLLRNAAEQRPTMNFLLSVMCSRAYGEQIKPAIKAFSERYPRYAERFAQKLDCDVEEVRPIVYMLIVSTTNYMIFGESSLFYHQLEPVKKALVELMETKKKARQAALQA